MVTHHYYSIEKAKKDFGYEPKVTLAEGIKLTVNDLNRQSIR
jgi:sterol-4alpha-carboxylate 3-dehydrogenase (decarboxylating)